MSGYTDEELARELTLLSPCVGIGGGHVRYSSRSKVHGVPSNQPSRCYQCHRELPPASETWEQRSERLLETLIAERQRHAADHCDVRNLPVIARALETAEAELAAERAVCLCGCPATEHENYGEDGEQCKHEDHVCLRVVRGVLEVVQEERQRHVEMVVAARNLRTRGTDYDDGVSDRITLEVQRSDLIALDAALAAEEVKYER